LITLRYTSDQLKKMIEKMPESFESNGRVKQDLYFARVNPLRAEGRTQGEEQGRVDEIRL
jgi:hypothetical protein